VHVEKLAKSFFRSLPYAKEPDMVVTTPHGVVSVFISPREEIPYVPGDVAFFIHEGTAYRIRLEKPMSRVSLVRGLRRIVSEVINGAMEIQDVKRGPA
jgi:hypothetical protein